MLERKNEAIISLRDRHDKPHATLHISGDAILQMRGKQNKQPKADYITAMMPVISTMRNSSLFFGEFGFLVDTKGIRHQLTELPDGVEVDGSLVIVEGSVTTLPDNMTVHGRLRIENGKLAALPRGLTVKGSLEIDYNRKIRDLPSDLVVEGRLSMRRTRIKKIPAGLKAEALYATGSELEVIPEGFTVQGDLYLSRTRVKALPSGIFVGGVLGIGETKIEALPEDLSCGGIDARESALKAIPPKVVRGGPVDVSHTKLHFIPCDLKAVGRLDVSGTEISSLPFDISQVEQLVLARSGVTALPEELGRKELKFLDISDTSIRKIPSDIIKIGELTARRCNLDTISAGIEIESLNIEGSTTVLPDNLSVRHLRMGEAKIKKLPDGLTVFSSLYATGSDLTEIGQNVRVGTGFFDISKTDVECIPASLKVGIGYCAGIDVSKTRMIALPDLGDVKVDWLSIEKTSIRDVPAGWSIKNIRARGAPLSSVFGKVEKAYGVSRKHAAAFTARGVNVVPWGIRHALLAPYRLGLEIAAVIAIVYASFAPPPENDRPV
ncbi:Leucine-rich repeat (LRR) protein [Rhizobium sp. BK176]|nr:Leucine-rich repeat (LRR) protein [Rhizobium sp. BK176]